MITTSSVGEDDKLKLLPTVEVVEVELSDDED